MKKSKKANPGYRFITQERDYILSRNNVDCRRKGVSWKRLSKNSEGHQYKKVGDNESAHVASKK